MRTITLAILAALASSACTFTAVRCEKGGACKMAVYKLGVVNARERAAIQAVYDTTKPEAKR